MPHFYGTVTVRDHEIIMSVNALTGLCLISTLVAYFTAGEAVVLVSMPSRAYASFLHLQHRLLSNQDVSVSMPSRAYASFLQG